MSGKDPLARPQPRKPEASPLARQAVGPGLRTAALLGFSNRFPPTDRVTLHIRYRSETSNATAAPATGRGCSQRDSGSTWKIPGRTPVAPTEVSFLPGSQRSWTPTHPKPPARQGGSSHRHAATTPWLLPARLPAAPPPPSGAQTGTTRLIQLKIFNTCHTRRITFYTKQDTSLKENTVQKSLREPQAFIQQRPGVTKPNEQAQGFSIRASVNFVSLNEHF